MLNSMLAVPVHSGHCLLNTLFPSFFHVFAVQCPCACWSHRSCLMIDLRLVGLWYQKKHTTICYSKLTAKGHIASAFLRIMCRISTGASLSMPKYDPQQCLFLWGVWSPQFMGSSNPSVPRVHTQMAYGIFISSAVLLQLMLMTSRKTMLQW